MTDKKKNNYCDWSKKYLSVWLDGSVSNTGAISIGDLWMKCFSRHNVLSLTISNNKTFPENYIKVILSQSSLSHQKYT